MSQKESIWRRHRLELVTSSLQCDFSPPPPKTPLQAVVDGDAMAADVPSVLAAQQRLLEDSEIGETSPAMQAITKVEHLRATPSMSTPQSPADVVGASLTAAAAAAAAAASSAAGTMYSAAAPLAAPIANNISAFTTTMTSPVTNMAAQLQNAANSGNSTAMATVATVTAAVESTKSHGRPLPIDCASPTEWYVADDATQRIRYFVIQGSDNMDHWRVNLTFDPVPFEDPTLGIKVHRGVYETAQQLYDRFLPLIQEHLSVRGPGSRIAFTGHSLGGSLGTLLMLMYVHRGVLSVEDIATVYTFGAPAVFCEAGEGACSAFDGCACGDEHRHGQGVLQKLDLPRSMVRNVLMHKDIVPRAFACDYSLVADLLRAVGESFREHRCLRGERRMLFNFVGTIMILQPAADATFVSGEGFHPMLPDRAGLFVLREPSAHDIGGTTLRPLPEQPSAIAPVMKGVTNLPANAAVNMDVAGGEPAAPTAPRLRHSDNNNNNNSSSSNNNSSSNGAKIEEANYGGGDGSRTIHEALWHLMNNPHPLDTLADPGAYGDAGSISRYHNPDNYTKAIGTALRARGAAWRAIYRRAHRAGVQLKPPTQHGSAMLGSVDADTTSTTAFERREPRGGKASPVPAFRR
jgi:hypothetical protein